MADFVFRQRDFPANTKPGFNGYWPTKEWIPCADIEPPREKLIVVIDKDGRIVAKQAVRLY